MYTKKVGIFYIQEHWATVGLIYVKGHNFYHQNHLLLAYLFVWTFNLGTISRKNEKVVQFIAGLNSVEMR